MVLPRLGSAAHCCCSASPLPHAGSTTSPNRWCCASEGTHRKERRGEKQGEEEQEQRKKKSRRRGRRRAGEEEEEQEERKKSRRRRRRRGGEGLCFVSCTVSSRLQIAVGLIAQLELCHKKNKQQQETTWGCRGSRPCPAQSECAPPQPACAGSPGPVQCLAQRAQVASSRAGCTSTPVGFANQTKQGKKKKEQAGSDCIRKGVRDETGKAKQSKAKQSKAKQSKAKQSKAKISKTLTSCNLLNKAVASCSESRYILYVRSAVTIW